MKYGRYLLLTTALTTLFALAPGTPVSAHADLESSTPSPSATLEQPPREIVLDFSEPVSRVEGSIELFDEQRKSIAIPEPSMPTSDRIEVRDVPSLDPGLYLIRWRALSQDGHIAQGAFTFQIGTTSTSVSADELLSGVSNSKDAARGLDLLRHLARSMTYLGLAAALGTLALLAAIGARRWRIIIVGTCVSLVGSLAQYVTQSLYASGKGWSGVLDGTAMLDVLASRLGRGIAVRVGLLLVLLVFVVIARRDRTSGLEMSAAESADIDTSVTARTWWRSSVALVGAGIIVTFSAAGHPSASSPAAIASAVDAVHLAAIVLWLGGLIGILCGLGDERFVRAHSRSATIALPLAVVTGVWQSWHLLDDVDDITSTEWGRALVVKVSIVLVVATIAVVARWIVLANRTSSLRQLVVVEVCAALAIIAATSVMVSSPPRVEAAPAVLSVSLAQDEIIANVTVTPGRVGANELHVTIVTPGGTLDPVDGLDIRMIDSSGEAPAVTVDVEVLGPNHFLGTVAILEAGPWNLELVVQVSPARVVRLSTTFEL